MAISSFNRRAALKGQQMEVRPETPRPGATGRVDALEGHGRESKGYLGFRVSANPSLRSSAHVLDDAARERRASKVVQEMLGHASITLHNGHVLARPAGDAGGVGGEARRVGGQSTRSPGKSSGSPALRSTYWP